jgi:hypothetical protein
MRNSIYAETCPHIFFYTNRFIKKAIDEALKYVISPPIETHRPTVLWKSNCRGVVSVIQRPLSIQHLRSKDVGLTNFTKSQTVPVECTPNALLYSMVIGR